MAKKDNTTDATAAAAAAVEAAPVVEEVATRQRRVLTDAILPSVENGFTGSIAMKVVGSDEEPIVFTYTTPELSEVQAKAMQAGFIARFSIVIGSAKIVDGKKVYRTKEELLELIPAEIVNLNNGIFSTRNTSTSSEFSDATIAMAILEKTKLPSEFLSAYDEVSKDSAFLREVEAAHEERSDLEKKAITSSEAFKKAKAAATYARSMA